MKPAGDVIRTPEKGFSLIEVLIVIALISFITILVVPSVSSYFKASLNAASRELAMTAKEAYNATLVTGKTHRIVYDLKAQQYWVEIGPTQLVLDTEATRERAARMKRFSKEKDSESEASSQSSFQIDKTVTRKKISLPRGVEFEDICTQLCAQNQEEPLKEGTGYTHIFANGITERTLIHIKDDSKHNFSLLLSSLGGMTDLYERYLPKEEAFEKK